MDDGTPDDSSSGVTIGDVPGGIHRSVIAGRDIIAEIVNTGDYNQFFVGDYERLADAYISAQSVFDRVDLDHFTGREWLLSAVDTFLQQRDRGYFVLQADAGLGKTTFLAWLVQQRGYIHHFCELVPGQEGIGPGLRNLAAQLALAYKLIPEGVLTKAADRPDYLYDLLKQAAGQLGDGEKIVLVVDALDEAGTPLHQNVLGLSPALPAGVYIVASQRPQHVNLSVDTPLTPYYPYLLAAESDANREDMRRFLVNAAAWPGVSQALQTSGYTSKQFVATLLDKCRGVWIYLRYVVHEIERGERSPLALDALPDGMAQYYAAYWQRWRVQAAGDHRSLNPKWHQLYRPFLTMLAASKEPSTVEQLAAWAGVSASVEELRWLCNEQWRPFLAATDTGQNIRYRFYHATLREFFEGKLAPERSSPYVDLVSELGEATFAANSCLVDRYLELWGGLEAQLPGLQDPKLRSSDQGYGLRHLAAHIAALGDTSRLSALLCAEWQQSRVEPYTREGWRKHLGKLLGLQPTKSTYWYENAWFAAKEVAGQSDSYLADVTHMWRLAEKQAAKHQLPTASEHSTVTAVQPSPVALQCRCALVVTSLNSLARNILPGLLTELVKKNIWLPQQGLAYARQVPNVHQRAAALAALASQLSSGERERVLGEAQRSAQSIDDSHYRAKALVGVAPHLSAQQLEEVLRSARDIEDNSSRAWVLACIAPHLSPNEQEQVLEEALRSAREIEDSQTRVETLVDLAPHVSPSTREQVLEEALRIARDIEHIEYRADAMGSVAAGVAQQGQIEDAMQIVKDIEERVTHVEANAQALAAVASYQAQQGQLREALRTVQSIEYGRSRAKALAAVASHLAEQGKLEEALRTARGIWDIDCRAQALAAVAPHLVEQRQLKEALHSSRSIEDDHDRELALAGMAASLAEQGQLEEAMWIVRSIDDSHSRAQALVGVATCLAEQGKLEEALHIAEGIKVSYNRGQALVAVASRLAEEGRLEEALHIFGGVEDSYSHTRALAGMASHLTEQGQLEEALQFARSVKDEAARAQALAAVAAHLTEKEPLMEALHSARRVRNLYARPAAMAGVAASLAEQGRMEEALLIARGFKDQFTREKALAAVAPHLAEHGQLEEALHIAQSIEDSHSQAQTLADVAARLAEHGQLEEALPIAHGIEDKLTRAQALASVAPHFAEQGKLEEALQIARGIKDLNYRAQALASVAPHFAEQGKLEEALQIARSVENSYPRAKALAGVASCLVEQGQLDEALHTAQYIDDSEIRAEALAAVAQDLAGLRLDMLHTIWLRTLLVLASRTRADLLSDLAALTPIIHSLGGTAAVVETAQAIQDVGRWWP